VPDFAAATAQALAGALAAELSGGGELATSAFVNAVLVHQPLRDHLLDALQGASPPEPEIFVPAAPLPSEPVEAAVEPVATVAEPSEAVAPTEAAAPDDLTAISGIGPKFAERLNAGGVATYATLAALSDAELEAILQPRPFQKPDYSRWRDEARALLGGQGAGG
jgi:predicted flap endonuclease-1-like 5' DNA nuclease